MKTSLSRWGALLLKRDTPIRGCTSSRAGNDRFLFRQGPKTLAKTHD